MQEYSHIRQWNSLKYVKTHIVHGQIVSLNEDQQQHSLKQNTKNLAFLKKQQKSTNSDAPSFPPIINDFYQYYHFAHQYFLINAWKTGQAKDIVERTEHGKLLEAHNQ